MAATTDEQIETVRALVAAIPAGRVATYGDIADAAALSSPRTVGWIMRTDTADLPWHRVVPASGRPATHLAHRQPARLALEGTPLHGDRVDLARARHRFAQPHERPSPGGPGHPDPPGDED
ncbi:MGMT family protein [Rhodococcus coprophilus]|uniref:MGMT family protein n=1 Tax=Rhodococcus coprophilus TaxID=38310 RepID=UPI0034058D0F